MNADSPVKLVADPIQHVRDYIAGLQAVLAAIPTAQVAGVLETLTEAYREGRSVLIVGNGGSAATASHMGCDLAKNIRPSVGQTGQGFRVISLTDNMPWITALGNDLGYEHIFSEQILHLARPGDLVIAISGSGNSPNIVRAVQAAKQVGARTVGLLGFDGGRVKDLVDRHVIIPSHSYGFVEDAHMVLDHILISYFQQLLRDGDGS